MKNISIMIKFDDSSKNEKENIIKKEKLIECLKTLK